FLDLRDMLGCEIGAHLDDHAAVLEIDIERVFLVHGLARGELRSEDGACQCHGREQEEEPAHRRTSITTGVAEMPADRCGGRTMAMPATECKRVCGRTIDGSARSIADRNLEPDRPDDMARAGVLRRTKAPPLGTLH